jgi:hypothetical protein
MLPSNAAVRKSEFSWATGRYGPFARARPNWGLERRNAGHPERRKKSQATPQQIAKRHFSEVGVP